jgi:hypothetical protein
VKQQQQINFFTSENNIEECTLIFQNFVEFNLR